jgi:hypothetical protein
VRCTDDDGVRSGDRSGRRGVRGGSAGKLSAILAAARARDPQLWRTVLLGSDLGKPLLSEHEIDDYYDVSGADVQAVGRIVAERPPVPAPPSGGR